MHPLFLTSCTILSALKKLKKNTKIEKKNTKVFRIIIMELGTFEFTALIRMC